MKGMVSLVMEKIITDLPDLIYDEPHIYTIFLFLNQNICCGYSKQMLKLMGKEIFTIL